MKFKRVSALVLIALTLFVQVGCWDRREIEDMAYIVALGIESAENSDTDRVITVQIVLPFKLAGGSGGGGGEGKSFYQLSVRAKSIYSALDTVQSTISRKISLLQCRAIIISEEYARKGIMSLIQVVPRHPELRRTIFIAVIPGKASEFLKQNEPKVTSNITRYWEGIAEQNRNTGYGSRNTFHNVIESTESLGGNAVTTFGGLGEGDLEEKKVNAVAGEIPREGGTRGEFMGVAVFKKDRMVGKLGKMEAEAFNLLIGEWKEAPIAVPDPADPKELLGISLRQIKPPIITADITTDPVKIDVELNLNVLLAAQLTNINYTSGENRLKLEEAIKEHIEDRARNLIDRAQTEFASDIFNFGNHAVKKKFLFWKEWEEFEWYKKFPTAEINVTANIHVRWFGDQNNPVQINP